jgi:hypothetical protein
MPGAMRNAPLSGLHARIDAMTDRTTLHEDDGMMTILS